MVVAEELFDAGVERYVDRPTRKLHDAFILKYCLFLPLVVAAVNGPVLLSNVGLARPFRLLGRLLRLWIRGVAGTLLTTNVITAASRKRNVSLPSRILLASFLLDVVGV